MGYKRGESREQFTLTPMCLDDYIEADSICRVIVAYVGTLDMKALGFRYSERKSTGCPPYDPGNMLSLYLYGYLNRIRSSRRLEAETHRNVEVMWLMEKLTPDDKTISEFRRNNAQALKKVFRAFSLWCSGQGLYGKEVVAVDGTKIRANSSRKNIHTKNLTQKQLEQVEKKIDEYMAALDKNDQTDKDSARFSPDAVREALKLLNEKKGELEGYLSRIEENGGKEISTVDPDCRMMKQGGNARNLDACYNVQVVSDDKNKLIVDFEVTNCPDDKGALPKMTESAKEIMGVREITAVADKGYYDGEDITDCEASGTTCLAPKKISGRNAPNPDYNYECFRYDKDADCYICPMGCPLPCKRTKKRRNASGKTSEMRLYYDFIACKGCPCKMECTKEKYGRTITRSQYQASLDTVDLRLTAAENRALLKKRKEIIEHPFGTIKRGWGFGNFLCRGLRLTTGEQSMVFLAYNFRRVFNIFKGDGKNLIAAMQ
jgi:transposase